LLADSSEQSTGGSSTSEPAIANPEWWSAVGLAESDLWAIQNESEGAQLRMALIAARVEITRLQCEVSSLLGGREVEQVCFATL
jgi:hypothetical protein